jgi:hypothetical protein
LAEAGATIAIAFAASTVRAQGGNTAPPTPATTVSKREAPDPVGDVLVPLVLGGAGGLGLAVALVQPNVGVSPYGDAGTTIISTATGLALALVANATKHTRFPGRMRVTVGSSTTHFWEYSLAYRASVAPQFALEAAVLVANDSYEDTRQQTQCGFFGCLTGNYLVDYRYEQMGAAVMRAVYEPSPTAAWRPSISIGGGPSHAVAEFHDAIVEERTGAVFDAMVSIQPSWLILELGVRAGTVDTRSANETALYLNLGFALGRR